MFDCATALQAAQEYGGWDWDCVPVHDITSAWVHSYFTHENMQRMFVGASDNFGGFTAAQCADAVCKELARRQAEL